MVIYIVCVLENSNEFIFLLSVLTLWISTVVRWPVMRVWSPFIKSSYFVQLNHTFFNNKIAEEQRKGINKNQQINCKLKNNSYKLKVILPLCWNMHVFGKSRQQLYLTRQSSNIIPFWHSSNNECPFVSVRESLFINQLF